MTELSRQWTEIFRAGDYGQKGKWTVADLDHLAESYDSAKHAAPVVIGHPEEDGPAYGWVKRLMRAGESLWAQLTKVAPEFEELVRQGRFLQRSVALYKDFPLTGGPYLRHLGFLGAHPPEVKGLQPLMLFSGQYTAVVEFSDAPPAMAPTQTVPNPRFNVSGRIRVDPASVELAEAAELPPPGGGRASRRRPPFFLEGIERPHVPTFPMSPLMSPLPCPYFHASD